MQEDQLRDHVVHAANSDLDIWWHNHDEEHGGLLPLFDQAHQVRTMMLNVPSKVHRVIERETRPSRFWPRLRSLAFIHPFSVDEDGPMFSSLPRYMDDCIVPHLRHLSIIGYSFDKWTYPIFSSSLTHLHLQGHREPGAIESSLTTMESTLDALRRMPHLENLVLADCFFLAVLEPLNISSGRLVKLPELSYLRVSSPAPMCTYVLEHLTIPDQCTLFIRFTMDMDYPLYDYESDENNVVGALLTKLSSDHSVFRTAVLSAASGCGPQIRLFREECCFPGSLEYNSWDTGLGYPSSFHLVVEVLSELVGAYAFDAPVERGKIIADVFSRLPLSQVTSLFVDADAVNEVPTHSLAAIASSLSKVTAMAASDGASAAIRRMLMISDTSRSPGTTVQNEGYSIPLISDDNAVLGCVFPSLQHLYLDDKDSPRVSDVQVDNYIALVHVLRARKHGGHILRSLLVPGMNRALHESPSPSMNRVNWIRRRVLASCIVGSRTDRNWNKSQAPPKAPEGPVAGHFKWSSLSGDWFLSNGFVNLRAVYAPDPVEVDEDFEPECSSSCLCRSLSF